MSDQREHMLSTIDNPFNPFEQFDEWCTFDETNGYHTLALLGRVAKVSDDLSEADYNEAAEFAMREIVETNASGVHILVART